MKQNKSKQFLITPSKNLVQQLATLFNYRDIDYLSFVLFFLFAWEIMPATTQTQVENVLKIYSQMSRQPLPREEINQIHEDCKDMGLLVGRGGIFSQVRKRLCGVYPCLPDVPMLALPLGIMLRYIVKRKGQ
jgi:hypothetical protein